MPTAHDVARLAGVSQSAVSRAFTEGASLSSAKRDRIVAAAAALGYRPNIIARSLIKRTSAVVGVVCGHFENPFFALALDRFIEALSSKGLRILLFAAETNATADAQVTELLSYRVCAVILMAADLSSTLAAECARSSIPVILFNRTARDDQGAFTVTGDNAVGAASIGQHFIASGRRNLAFMAGYENSSTSRQREDGFVKAVRQAGLPAPRRIVGNYNRHDAVAATRSLFTDPATRPDALFCANDLMAISAVETLRAEFGLEPGQACAVAGFDNIPMAAWPSFALTTYSQPIEAMVAAAVDYIAGEPGEPRQVIVEGALILRKSA